MVDRGSPASGQAGILTLLANRPTIELLRALEGDVSTRPDLEQRLRSMSRSRLTSRLAQLLGRQLIICQHIPARRARVGYVLTPAGRGLLEIAEALSVALPGATSSPDMPLAALIASRGHRAIIRALAYRPLTGAELELCLPSIPHATLLRSLNRLRDAQLLVARRGNGRRHVRYELTTEARRLGRTAVLVARWRWRWTPEHVPAGTTDLASVVHLVAPLASVPRISRGVCMLHAQPPPGANGLPDVYLSVANGRVTPLAVGSPRDPDCRMRAAPASWCEALMSGDSASICMQGDRRLGEVVITALAGAVRPEPRGGRRAFEGRPRLRQG